MRDKEKEPNVATYPAHTKPNRTPTTFFSLDSSDVQQNKPSTNFCDYSGVLECFESSFLVIGPSTMSRMIPRASMKNVAGGPKIR